jgi:hypothetical protein
MNDNLKVFSEFSNKTIIMLFLALSVALGSVWRDLSTKVMDRYFPGNKEQLIPYALYTLTLTFIIVFLGFIAEKLTGIKV